MSRHAERARLLLSLLLLGMATAGQSFAAPPTESWVFDRNPQRIADLIDQRLAGPVAAEMPVIDDAAFLRRASLDLIGRIPTVAEARAFLADERSDKRRVLVAKLTRSPEFAGHMATVLRRIWAPQTDTQQFSRLIADYEEWLARRLRAKTAFDELVRQQLTVPVERVTLPVNPDGDELGSTTFLTVSQLHPEDLAANTSRAFLGLNIDCAQCHDHPFARWTRKEFWETAAFFTRPAATSSENGPASLTLAIGDTSEKVSPRLFTGEEMNWPEEVQPGTGRDLLAAWITSRENPFFTRNAVNRLWANFFGYGFVEPLDDLSGAIAPSHPELLEELSHEFADSQYDLAFLVEGMVLSRAWQRPSADVADAPQEFQRMPVRTLSGEQLYDSLHIAAGLPAADRGAIDRLPERAEFVARFFNARSVEGRRSLVQALTLMNGQLTSRVTGAKSPVIRALTEVPFFNDDQRIETLFLAAYTRRPTPEEMSPLRRYLRESPDRATALGDILWALLNSSEFNTNH